MFKQITKKLVTTMRAPCLVLVVVGVVVTGMGVAVLPVKHTEAATSSTINFQARLLGATGGLVPDGNYNVEFKLYNTLTSSGSSQGSCTGDSNCLWTETRTTTNQVRVANGYLTVNLGSVTGFGAINWDQPLWLTMNIGGTAVSPTWDGEMSPRLQLTAVPYAFRAGQLATNNSGNIATLGFTTPTAARSILLPDASGTVCLQSSASCGFATSSGSGNYIQNGTSTQTANFNIQSAGTGSVTAIIQGAVSQTADLLQVITSSTGYGLKVDSTGRTFTGDNLFVGVNTVPGSVTNGRLTVVPANVNTLGQVIRTANTIGTSATNVDSLQIQDSAGVCAWRISNVATSGATSSGSCDNSTTSSTGSYQTQFRTGDVTSSGSGTSGVAILRSGNNTVGGNTGAVTIKSGDATTTGTGISGAVTIDTGSGLGGTSGITIGGTNASSLTIGKTTANILTTINGRALVLPTSGNDSTTAFQVQNASGYALLTADSSNSRTMLGNVTSTVGQGVAGALYFADGTNDNFGLTLNTNTLTLARTISLPNASGTICLQGSASCGFATGAATDYIQNTTSAQAANEYVQAATSGTVAATFRANASGSGDILDLLNGGGTTVGSVGSTGSVLFKPSTNATTAFQIQPSGSTTPVLNVDTSNSRVGIGLNNPTYTLDVVGDINSSTALRIAGTSVCDTTGTTGCIAKSGSGFYIHNQTTVQASNLYVQAATTGTVAGVFQAFNGGTGDIIDFLNGTGATVGSISSTGAALHKNSTNSATAFQVQSSGSSTSILDVDTSNGRVGIGTNAPTRILDVSANNTQVTAPLAIFQQAGTGDANVEFKAATANSNYYVGVDASNADAFTINSYAAATTSSSSTYTLGYTVNNGASDFNTNNVETTDFTTTTAGTISSITVDFKSVASGTDTVAVALYADNSGTPGALLASSSPQVISITTVGGDNYNTVSIPTTAVGATTKYWLAFNTSGNDVYWHATSGSGHSIKYVSHVNTSWPDPFGTPSGTDTNTALVISATVTPSASFTDANANAIFTLKQTGATVFKNSTNSVNAFQLQGSNSAVLFNADTTNSRIGIGIAIPSYPLDVVGDINSSTGLRIGGTTVCTSAGCTPTSGSNNYLQLQGSTPGSAQTGNFNITGTGIAGTLKATSFDSTGTTLSVGSGATSGITLQQSTTVASGGGLAVSGGATSLTGLSTGSSTALFVGTGASSNKGLTIQGASGQFVDYVQIQDTNGTSLLRVDAGANLESIGSINTPYGGSGPYGNLLTYSEQFNNAAWVTGGTLSVTADSTVAPDQTSTADTLAGTGSSTLTQTYTTATNGTYTFSVWVKTTSGTATVGLRIDSTGASPTTGTVTTGTARTSWQRFNVTQAFTGTPSNIKAVILPGNGSTGTVYTWGAQMVLNGSPQIYARTTASTVAASRGIVGNGSALFVNGTNSTAALTVQNATGVNQLAVDTTNSRVILGTSGGDTVGTILVFGNKTNAGDPTEVDGAMYYNSSTDAFRCGINGDWRDCTGGLINSSTAVSSAISNTTTITNFSGGTGNSFSTLANDCAPGVVYDIKAQGVLSNTTNASIKFYLNIDGTGTALVSTPNFYAIASNAAASNLGWQLTASLICDTTGGSGTLEAQGVLLIAGSTTASSTLMLVNTATKTIDTTTTHSIFVGVGWNAASAINTITMRQLIVQRIGPS
jgi:hypothetical protein